MANKRRGRYPCESCEYTFETPQSKWGHYPHCEGRKLSQQPATQSKGEAPHSDSAGRESRRPGPDSQENKLLLLESQELIEHFQEHARHYAAMSYLVSGMNVRGEYEKAKEWAQVYLDLSDV